MRVVARPFHSLASTVLRNVVAAAGVFAMVVGVFYCYHAYHKELDRVEKLTTAFAKAYVPMLTVGIWDIEADALQHQVDLIAGHPEIAEARVSAATGMTFLSGSRPQQRAPDRRIPIPHPADQGETLGELDIWYDQNYINQAITESVVISFLEFVLFALVVSLITYRIIFARLNKPLRTLADYSRQLNPGRRNPPLELERTRHHWEDEIDLMVEGFNTLRDGIARFSEERDQAIRALSEERDRLDDRIRQRTEDVSNINAALEFLSRLSVKLIDVPAAGQPQAIRDALSESAERLGATAGGIALAPVEGEWTWCYQWTGTRGELPDIDVLARAEWFPGWYVGPASWSDGDTICSVQMEGERYLLLFREPANRLYTPLEERLIRLLGEILFKVIERWQRQRQLEASRRELYRLSRTDPLTGLANRRYFTEVREQEGRRAQRSGEPISVLMIDVDYFKAYNDQYGHSQGDRCLVRLAEVFRHQCARAGELSVRLGGEEFAILLPTIDAEEALAVADRVRKAVFDLAIPHDGSPLGWVTVSIGCATWFGDYGAGAMDTVFDRMMRDADHALYRAKEHGRNRVEGAAPLTLVDG
ncbi:sensor domain-containing diguanylate cyclase [Marinobacter mangrovi]|uniref:sensor domain-containing diguanylate cyclase n=1 Tax=Marinobacter mangrovi TaxID=2803918 RepID=UPI0019339FE4|nr:diguanylate cyclase [Marinobacter mangrovi]